MQAAVELAEAYDDLMNHSDPNMSVSDYWASKLQCAPQCADFYLSLSALMSKMDLVRSAIDAHISSERAKSLYLSATGSLYPFIHPAQVHGHHVKSLRGVSKEIDVLHLAADALPKNLVPEINKITLDSLTNEINELIIEVNTSDIDNVIKHLIISQLSTLAMSIRCYPIFGSDGVARVYGAAVAELVRVGQIPASNAKAERSLLTKSISFAKKMGAVVVWAHAVVSGAEGILTDGSSMLGLDYQTTDSSEPGKKGED